MSRLKDGRCAPSSILSKACWTPSPPTSFERPLDEEILSISSMKTML